MLTSTSYGDQVYSEAKDNQSEEIRGLQNVVCEWNTIAQALGRNYNNFGGNRASFWNDLRLVVKRGPVGI